MTDQNLPTYLSSERSVAILTRAVGSREAALSILSDALRGGVVSALGRNADDHKNRIRPVPPAVWRDATDQDRQRWSWSGGVFISSSRELLTLGGNRYENVTFDTLSILNLCEQHGDPNNLCDTPAAKNEMGESDGGPTSDFRRATGSRGGNPGKVEIWHRFWLEAMTMLYDGDLDRASFPTQKSLMDELRRRIDDGLSEESVKPHISKIWLKFVSREG